MPLDKSWIIRLGILDILHGHANDIGDFLASQNPATLGTDLQALLRVCKQWDSGQVLDVGESGTLYRFLQFAAWKLGQPKQFKTSGTLAGRAISQDPSIADMPLAELLQLDNGTSQWASAAVLLGNTEARPSPMPYKLALTYEALEHWQKARSAGRAWQPRYDRTILAQAEAYVQWRKTGTMDFTPEQAEDYCFARAFDLMTAPQGEARWPSLRQHESDRIASMEVALAQDVVDSADHRVVQAVALRRGSAVTFANPGAVAKSWPLFWQFFDYTSSL